MIYEVEKIGEIAVMTLTLENITMVDNVELQNAFTSLLDVRIKNIVLDLSRINFISSIVLASLVFMLKRATEAGGNLLMCGVKNKVKEDLSMTKLDRVFDIFENRKKALNKFAHLF